MLWQAHQPFAAQNGELSSIRNSVSHLVELVILLVHAEDHDKVPAVLVSGQEGVGPVLDELLHRLATSAAQQPL